MEKIKVGIEKVLALSDQDRFLLAGQFVTINEFRISPDPPEELRRRGERWLNEQIDKVKESICLSKDARLASMDSEELTLGLTIADILLQAYGHLPVVLISVQIVKNGLKTMCHEIWEKNGMD